MILLCSWNRVHILQNHCLSGFIFSNCILFKCLGSPICKRRLQRRFVMQIALARELRETLLGDPPIFPRLALHSLFLQSSQSCLTFPFLWELPFLLKLCHQEKKYQFMWKLQNNPEILRRQYVTLHDKYINSYLDNWYVEVCKRLKTFCKELVFDP